MKPKIACVVVLYNPDSDVLINIMSYINQVDKLFAVDNSEMPKENFVQQIKLFSSAEYICNGKNLGIAAALNIGVRKSIAEGFDYLLTMDQDSEAPTNMVNELGSCFALDNKISLAAPVLIHPDGRSSADHAFKTPYEQILTAWTSGNLIKLDIFKYILGFKEELFIDYVDHEFCLRLNQVGYKIYRCNKTILKHHLGKIKSVNFFFRKVYPTNHSALRLYYRTRNRFYVQKTFRENFPEFFKRDNLDFWRSIFKVMLFESDRLKKLKFMLKGYKDFKNNIYGKYKYDAAN